LAGGSKVKLVLLLCTVTAVLSAFLDNVTTILLIAPVTCKLCKLVNVDPRSYLVAEAIFSNVGGTATMIGDPPNIIVGNMLKEHLDFTAFLINLAPAVLFTSPFIFFYIWFVYRKDFEGRLEADVPALQKMYPITNRGLLIKCMLVLGCVILCFFLHPVTHVDPAFVAILGERTLEPPLNLP
jgi:Na+/H+ antiporter NhaD/arsenite permease-like protein